MTSADFANIADRINRRVRSTATHMAAAAAAIVAVEEATGNHTTKGSWAVKLLAAASALGLYAAKSPGRRIAEGKAAKMPPPAGQPVVDAGDQPWGTPPGP